MAVIAGALLPSLARRDPRLLPQEGDDEQMHVQRLRLNLHQWREEALVAGKSLRFPRRPLLLRDIWMAAMVLFTVLMLSSFWISTVTGAIIMISLVGICWSVACWVPFAIIMEVRIPFLLLVVLNIYGFYSSSRRCPRTRRRSIHVWQHDSPLMNVIRSCNRRTALLVVNLLMEKPSLWRVGRYLAFTT